MTIDIWMPMAVIAGVAALILYRKGRALVATMILAAPPLVLLLYVVTKLAANTHDMLQWAGLTAGWLLAAGLAALCALCWLGARAIKDKFYLAAVGFAGAALGLLIAGYAFGATGTDWPETIAWAGFVITFGSHLMLRNKAEGDSEDVRAFAPGDS